VEAEYVEELEDLDADAERHWAVDVALLAGGLALLVLGARWLVDGAVEIAEALGLSELVIGLTVVAAGTSLPEAATSIVAGFRGQRDIAVGNVVGSNLFNLLAVLGLSASVSPDGVLAPDAALRFDLPVLVGAAVLCLAVFFTDWTISRWEGGLLLALYAAYLTHIVMDAGDSPALDAFRAVAGVAVLAAIATLAVTSARAARQVRDGARA
jgi:cation:H+ antiporter